MAADRESSSSGSNDSSDSEGKQSQGWVNGQSIFIGMLSILTMLLTDCKREKTESSQRKRHVQTQQ